MLPPELVYQVVLELDYFTARTAVVALGWTNEHTDAVDPTMQSLGSNILQVLRQAGIATVAAAVGYTGYPSFDAIFQLNVICLPKVPAEIGLLPQLMDLHIYGCSCTDLPDTIGELSALHALHITRTPLRSLPDVFHRLPKLCQLDIEDTELQSLPPSLFRPTRQRLQINWLDTHHQ